MKKYLEHRLILNSSHTLTSAKQLFHIVGALSSRTIKQCTLVILQASDSIYRKNSMCGVPKCVCVDQRERKRFIRGATRIKSF